VRAVVRGDPGFDFCDPGRCETDCARRAGHRLILRPESRLRKRTVAMHKEILDKVPVPPMPALDYAE